MPIYEYSCSSCGRTFEELILRAADEEEVACPGCGSDHLDRLVSAPAIRGGGGEASAGGGRDCGPVGGG